MKSLHLIILASFILLNGCANYMLQGNRESVVTETVSKDTFTVNFCGNAFMNRKEALKYAMQRACELALTKGYTHFVILKKSDQSEMCSLQDAPRDMFTSGAGQTYGEDYSAPSPQKLVRPNVLLKIQCYAQNPPQDAIDAQQYLDDNFPGLKF